MQCMFSLAMLLLYLNCRSDSPNPLMLIFATIFNLTRIAEFFYLIVVVMLYKKIGRKIKKFIRSCFSKKEEEVSDLPPTRRVTHR
jgi:hypothetical protein